MKKLAMTLTLLCLLAGSLWAQNDPYGVIDTLSLEQKTVGAGQEFTIDVNLWNDEELGGLTIPLIYPTDKLENPQVEFSGGRIEYIGTKPVTIDQTAGTILVGAIVFLESYIQPGNGPLFRIRFKLKDGLTPGETAAIDSTSIPPAHILLTHANASNIIPVFESGLVTVGEANSAPVFDPVPDVYIAEGESLYIDIRTTDRDGDAVTLANTIHPLNSQFVDNGDGTGRFSWRPDYVGPTSSEQSPYDFVFWASDGKLSTSIHVAVNVLNVNRAPEIDAPPLVQAEAGDSVGINVSGLDPDFETLEWSINNLPSGASFDYNNPGLINWVSSYGDSGNYFITLIATDPSGMTDTAEIEIDLSPVALYTVRIDTVSSFSGRTVNLAVYLKNKPAVKEFDLVMNFDPILLYPTAVINVGTRSEDFEFFEYRLNDGGNVGDLRIMGRADVAGDPIGQPLDEGDGPICIVKVQVSSNLSYVGNLVPVRFMNRLPDDNILTDADGVDIPRSSVNWFNGSILIASPGPVNIGDINVNGLAFEISDAVYFSNFFISPNMAPLDEQQLLNSDINQDGLAPSVADLVMMIQVIAGIIEQPVYKPAEATATAEVGLSRERDGLYLTINSPVDVGGALFRLGGPDVDRAILNNLTDMELQSGWAGDRLSCLLTSFELKSVSFGENAVIKVSDDPSLDITIEEAELADTHGRVLNIETMKNAVLPSRFALYQNAPNPFNPSTEIRFDLDAAARVTLTVYNILGQEVIRLADQEFPAGSHSVTWDGNDEFGQSVASGIYLYRIDAGGQTASRKMVLMK